MAYDWVEESRRQREADEFDRQRAKTQRENTTRTAKTLISTGDVAAAMALYGIEPRSGGQQPSPVSDLQGIQLQFMTVLNKLQSIVLDYREPPLSELQDAYGQAASALDHALSALDFDDPGLSNLQQLQVDYQWLLDGPLSALRSDFDELVTRVSAHASEVIADAIRKKQVLGPSAVPWKPVELSKDDWNEMSARRDKSEKARKYAAELREKVNHVRDRHGLSEL